MNGYLTVAELAARCGVARQTIEHHIAHGKIASELVEVDVEYVVRRKVRQVRLEHADAVAEMFATSGPRCGRTRKRAAP